MTEQANPRATLLLDVLRVMAPTGCYAPATLRRYRVACRRYERFAGGPQSVGDVSPQSLRDFSKWHAAEGFTEHSAKTTTEHVATIVRIVCPEVLPRKTRRPRWADAVRPKGGRSRKRFSDDVIEGSMESVMVNAYFPSKSRIATKSTELQYANATAKFSRFLGRPAMLTDLNDVALGSWMRAMRDDGLAAKTINGYMNKIRAFWTWAAKKRLVELFPTIENAPEPRRIPRSWTEAQMRALLAACDKMPGHVADVRASAWWRALHLVAFDTGERKSALLALPWDCFDAETGELEARAEIRKGGKKPMLYHLKAATVAAVEAIRRPTRQVIFAWDRCEPTFHGHYKRLLKLAGLPYESRRSGLQKVRRTFASHIEANGGNATAALDHTARKVTVESYLDPRVIKTAPANLALFDL